MIKSDNWIIKMCEEKELLSPFIKELVRKKENDKKLSYGVSSYGYDIRLDTKLKIFSNKQQWGLNRIIDPKEFNENNYIEIDTAELKQNFVIVPPHSFVLGVSIEKFNMPRNVTGLVFNKSTYARCGLNCFTTVIEAGWKGNLVLEFANNTDIPIKLYTGEGCAQILFLESDEDCKTSYEDRGGKYQNQTGVQTPIC